MKQNPLATRHCTLVTRWTESQLNKLCVHGLAEIDTLARWKDLNNLSSSKWLTHKSISQSTTWVTFLSFKKNISVIMLTRILIIEFPVLELAGTSKDVHLYEVICYIIGSKFTLPVNCCLSEYEEHLGQWKSQVKAEWALEFQEIRPDRKHWIPWQLFEACISARTGVDGGCEWKINFSHSCLSVVSVVVHTQQMATIVNCQVERSIEWLTHRVSIVNTFDSRTSVT